MCGHDQMISGGLSWLLISDQTCGWKVGPKFSFRIKLLELIPNGVKMSVCVCGDQFHWFLMSPMTWMGPNWSWLMAGTHTGSKVQEAFLSLHWALVFGFNLTFTFEHCHFQQIFDFSSELRKKTKPMLVGFLFIW